MIDDRLHDLVGAYALGALDATDRAAFERHLAECQACASEVRSLQPVVDGLAQVVPLVDPPAALRERVYLPPRPGKVGRRPGAPRTSDSTTTAPIARPVAPVVGLNWGWLAAAASVLLAVGLGVYVWQLRDRLTQVERRLDEASARAAASETQVAALQRAAVDVRTTALVIGAPNLLRVDLAGQGGSAAKARAFWSRAHGLVFAAVDLPALPPGKVYQLWVVGAQAPVSAGIFEPDAAGRATTIVEAGRQFPEPAAFAVTLEPAGGVPQPTGDKSPRRPRRAHKSSRSGSAVEGIGRRTSNVHTPIRLGRRRHACGGPCAAGRRIDLQSPRGADHRARPQGGHHRHLRLRELRRKPGAGHEAEEGHDDPLG